MLMFYLVCAGIGSVTLVVLFVISCFGVDPHDSLESGGFDHGGGHDGFHDIAHGGHGDLHNDSGDNVTANTDQGAHEAAKFMGFLSIRAIAAALTFFGWTGAAASASISPYIGFLMAVAAGGFAMFIVAWLMSLFQSLYQSGAVRIENCLGQSGSVYLRIPGGQSATGRVMVTVQGRTMEYLARTSGEELAPGTPITVTGVLGADMLEVEAAN